ncbi:MAG: hypothetical protein V2A69_11155 [Pseudomonadota bacterium]
MMRKSLKSWKMRCVVISKNKVIVRVLEMIAIAHMADVTRLTNNRLVQL